MNQTPRQFLEKVINVRQHLMRTGLSQRNEILSSVAIRLLEGWLNAYPHATDVQVAAHIRRNYGTLQAIMPGGASANAAEFQNQLNYIIENYAYQNQA